ncbi:hypothetical protein T01_15377 [Trichinella spiralis]|uniref:Uncharacterized protein n=1 Tax=Trichinella spiralis TaxID=6334 RepID=A0A0V1BDY6_TRISP|nr:hypothetical protein T01_15377 [Trichinella spiralis]
MTNERKAGPSSTKPAEALHRISVPTSAVAGHLICHSRWSTGDRFFSLDIIQQHAKFIRFCTATAEELAVQDFDRTHQALHHTTAPTPQSNFIQFSPVPQHLRTSSTCGCKTAASKIRWSDGNCGSSPMALTWNDHVAR